MIFLHIIYTISSKCSIAHMMLIYTPNLRYTSCFGVNYIGHEAFDNARQCSAHIQSDLQIAEVMAFPEAEEAVVFPEKFGTSGRCHGNLQMPLLLVQKGLCLESIS